MTPKSGQQSQAHGAPGNADASCALAQAAAPSGEVVFFARGLAKVYRSGDVGVHARRG